MTDAFAGLVDPIFHHVIELRDIFRGGEHPSPESVKRGLTRVIQEAQGRATDTQATDFALARFALVYWSDEVLIKSSWRYADDWKNNILERDYFGTRRAAVDFWVRAEQAEAKAHGGGRSPRSVDPLEVFFLCAALGFRGDRFQNEEEIAAWAARVGPIIRDGRPEPLPLSTGTPGRGPLGELRGDRMRLIASVLVSATLILTLIGFIIAVHDRGTP